MSIVLDWKRQYRKVTIDRGRWTGTESWKLSDTTDQVITAADIWAALVAGAATYAVWGNESGIPVMRWMGTDMQPVDASKSKVWDVTLTYESPTADSGTTSTHVVDLKTESEAGFTSLEVDCGGRVIEVWRNDTSGSALAKPTYGDSPGLTTNITGGEYVDAVGGDPISITVSQVKIAVRNVVIGRPDYATLAAAVNKRNSADYLFGASGEGFTVLRGAGVFLGASTSRIAPNTYAVTWNFVSDQWYHLVQVADRHPVTGRPILIAADLTNPLKALNVYWRQPFPNTVAFSTLGMVFS